jgi:transcriptional regulator with XRE-family HTH domain
MGERNVRARRKSPVAHDTEALRWALNATGHSYYWLAGELGISRGHMSEIANGTRILTDEKLRQTAELLGCPESVLRAKAPEAA